MCKKNDGNTAIQLRVETAGKPGCVDLLVAAVVNLVSLSNASHEFLTVVLPLVLDELLRNAVSHGNRNDINKKITVSVTVLNNLLDLEVADEGEGFNYKNMADTFSKVDAYSGSGRGLQIVREYSRNIKFKNDGSHIVVQLKID